MTDTEKLAAYQAMQRELETLYADALLRLEKGKATEKQKTAGYREALGWKIYYRNMLEMYARYGLGEKPRL
ncbi:MAG: hypothetical protein LKJ90_04280 [Faecalibacterium sp.]|nr:hypothetical protein [Faecalibacterium sp.]